MSPSEDRLKVEQPLPERFRKGHGGNGQTPAHSERASPFLGAAHRHKHHGEKDNLSKEEIESRKARRGNLGKKIQHGLQKSSFRNTGLPSDCYIGLAFRTLDTREAIDDWQQQTGNVSKSVVHLDQGEKLLVWQAVLSDGE